MLPSNSQLSDVFENAAIIPEAQCRQCKLDSVGLPIWYILFMRFQNPFGFENDRWTHQWHCSSQ
jgi:hypothetical protein